jgi:hypothetical protein
LYYFDPPSKLGLNESIGIRVSRFSYNSAIKTHTTTYYAYFNFQNKNIKPLLNASTKFIVLITLLFFIDIGKNPIIVDDATKSSNPSVVPIQNEEFVKTSFDMNVSQ